MPPDPSVIRVSSPDVVVLGAGIIGAACALELQTQGRKVLLVDNRPPGGGVTSAGMGHLVALDETDDELDLCLLSLARWEEYLSLKGGIAEYTNCGTLWIAEDEDQMAHALSRAERLSRRGWNASLVSASELTKLEPSLRSGLVGATRVTRDGAVFPPSVAADLARTLVHKGGQTLFGETAIAVQDGALSLASGRRIQTEEIVIAAGVGVHHLLPDVLVFPRKGHLAITDRYAGRLSHQVVSMGYGQAAVGEDAPAVAANVQPRLTGQWLVGSCRQDGVTNTEVDPYVLAKVLRSAIAILPCLAEMRIIRSWTGMRPATRDGRPLIGLHPSFSKVWLAVGHEGLGVTTAFATASLLGDLMLNRIPSLDASLYCPKRFSHRES